MNKSEKRFLITSLVGVLLYLIATLWFLSQPGCAWLDKPPVIYPGVLMECASIARDCMDDIQDAKDYGDPNQLVLATAQCSIKWVNAGCSEAIADMIKQGKGGK